MWGFGITDEMRAMLRKPAMAECDKVCIAAFANLFRKKANRTKAWQ